MKWLRDNPLSMVLAGICGVFMLIMLMLAVFWALPVAVNIVETNSPDSNNTASVLTAHQVAELSEFQIINQKPVFNESRLPVISQLAEDGSEQDLSVAINGAPELRLTGVIITPEVRIASLTPLKGDQKSVMAHEGQPLSGEYAGWQVSSVSPRNVVLESRDGETMNLDMQIHDTTIKEPPKPKPKPVVETNSEQREVARGEDGEPLTRAAQIRLRIAERREELRREQEESEAGGGQTRGRQSQSQRRAEEERQENRAQDYQSAIRRMMQNNRKDQAGNDSDDG